MCTRAAVGPLDVTLSCHTPWMDRFSKPDYSYNKEEVDFKYVFFRKVLSDKAVSKPPFSTPLVFLL